MPRWTRTNRLPRAATGSKKPELTGTAIAAYATVPETRSFPI